MKKVKEYVYCVKKIACKNLLTGDYSKEIMYDTFENPVEAYQLCKKLGGHPSFKVESIEITRDLTEGQKPKKYKFAVTNEFNPEDLFGNKAYDTFKEAYQSIPKGLLYLGCHPDILPLEENLVKAFFDKTSQDEME